MRKILLATTALVGFAAAGAAQAATTSPLNVTVGGSVDFVAGAYNEARGNTNGDFETLYSLNFGVTGKAANGLEYGGNLVLDNYPEASDYFAAQNDGVRVSEADVFVSGIFGKVQAGDFRGATDLAVVAPTVGEGQVTGRYINFLGTTTFAKNLVVGIDGTDHSTNVTYYTPKLGNDMHKVQAAVTYAPNVDSTGNSIVQTGTSTYKNMFKGVLAYEGAFKDVATGFSADVISASSDDAAGTRDFMAWGLGAKVAYNGFTLGGTYTDLGHYNTNASTTQNNKDQQVYTVGLTYEIDKVAVGVSYLGGQGHDSLGVANSTYVKRLNTYGIGGAYTWAPGLTTNVDGILFDQKLQAGTKNSGYVLLLSQKLAF
ncbi:MAG: porin [Alphaproteobacteria bacterium]|nr:porin [Alphaproteobacteria bacterium]